MIITEALLRFVVLLVFKSLRCMYYKDDTRDDLWSLLAPSKLGGVYSLSFEVRHMSCMLQCTAG